MAFYTELPLDKNRFPYPAPPAKISNQSQSGVPAASSVITFSDKTMVLDVTVTAGAAGASAVIGKWGVSSVTASNFDWVVQAGQNRSFAIPVSVMGAASVASANVANGLYTAVSVKDVGAAGASILTAEY